jgi:hypothetical protein
VKWAGRLNVALRPRPDCRPQLSMHSLVCAGNHVAKQVAQSPRATSINGAGCLARLVAELAQQALPTDTFRARCGGKSRTLPKPLPRHSRDNPREHGPALGTGKRGIECRCSSQGTSLDFNAPTARVLIGHLFGGWTGGYSRPNSGLHRDRSVREHHKTDEVARRLKSAMSPSYVLQQSWAAFTVLMRSQPR